MANEDRKFAKMIFLAVICLFGVAQGNIDSEGFGEKLFSENLPWYYEQNQNGEPELADNPWDQLHTADILKTQLDRGMRLRARRELDLLERTLRGDAVPYDSTSTLVGEEETLIPRRMVRSNGAPSPNLENTSSAKIHWKPLTIGLICAVFGILAIIGAVTYLVMLQSSTKHSKNEAGRLVTTYYDQKSSPEVSLGDASLLNLDGDRKLAHSAQMYHYQHQKQQMLAVEKANGHTPGSDDGTGSEVEDEDFTVYECPGLAEPSQLELENPLYEGDAVAGETGIQAESDNGLHQSQDDDDEASDSTPTSKIVGQS